LLVPARIDPPGFPIGAPAKHADGRRVVAVDGATAPQRRRGRVGPSMPGRHRSPPTGVR
jgi:hypothetical protein